MGPTFSGIDYLALSFFPLVGGGAGRRYICFPVTASLELKKKITWWDLWCLVTTTPEVCHEGNRLTHPSYSVDKVTKCRSIQTLVLIQNPVTDRKKKTQFPNFATGPPFGFRDFCPDNSLTKSLRFVNIIKLDLTVPYNWSIFWNVITI